MVDKSGDGETRERRGRVPAPSLTAVLVGVVGVLFTLLAFDRTRTWELDRARSAFEMSAQDRVADIRRELAAQLEQLHALSALYESSEVVERDEFTSFNARGLERNPAIRCLLWIEHEPGGRADGSDDRYLNRFVEPAELEPALLGLDHGKDPARREELVRSMREGRLVMTGPLDDPGGRATGTIVQAVLPVFAPGYRPDVDSPRDALVGFVGAQLQVEELVHRALQGAHGIQMDLVVTDRTDPAAPAVLRRPEIAHAGGSSIHSEEAFEVAGRTWRVSCTAPPGFLASQRSREPWGVLGSGLAVSLLLALTVGATTSRARIRGLVQSQTAELERTNRDLLRQVRKRSRAEGDRRQLEAQLRQVVDLVPHMIYARDGEGRFILVNVAAAEAFGSTVPELTGARRAPEGPEGNEHPDAERVMAEDRRVVESGAPTIIPVDHFTDAQGRRRIYRTVKIPYKVRGDERRAVLCVAVDITERVHAEEALRGQNRVLERVASGAGLKEVLSALVGSAEEAVPGMICSVLLMDPSGKRLVHGAAPSLPAFYNEAVDGLEVGPNVGSCGAAAFTRQPVIVRDVMEHPNWEPYREIAQRAGIRASWSWPILSADREVLGTFAMYYAEPREPDDFELDVIRSTAHIAGIAIEREQEQARVRPRTTG